jgi:antitoxin VapB
MEVIIEDSCAPIPSRTVVPLDHPLTTNIQCDHRDYGLGDTSLFHKSVLHLTSLHETIYKPDDITYSTSVYIQYRNYQMKTTKVFRNGNSQAIRIPSELAYDRTDIELEIERVGDELRIRPACRPLTGVLKKFAKFGPDFMADGRGDQEQADRDAL